MPSGFSCSGGGPPRVTARAQAPAAQTLRHPTNSATRPAVSVTVSAAQAALRSDRNIVCRPCDQLLTPEEVDFPEDFPEDADRAHPASVAACAPAYVSALLPRPQRPSPTASHHVCVRRLYGAGAIAPRAVPVPTEYYNGT